MGWFNSFTLQTLNAFMENAKPSRNASPFSHLRITKVTALTAPMAWRLRVVHRHLKLHTSLPPQSPRAILPRRPSWTPKLKMIFRRQPRTLALSRTNPNCLGFHDTNQTPQLIAPLRRLVMQSIADFQHQGALPPSLHKGEKFSLSTTFLTSTSDVMPWFYEM
jgi:hypothetical protein